MSNRVKGCTVVFEQDLTEEDAAQVIAAISSLRYVLSAGIIETEIHDHINRARVAREYEGAILTALKGLRP